MHVSFKNKSQPQEFKHRCDVCNQGFNWSEESSYYERGVGEGYRAYEIQFIICSNECRESPELEKLLEIFGKRKS